MDPEVAGSKPVIHPMNLPRNALNTQLRFLQEAVQYTHGKRIAGGLLGINEVTNLKATIYPQLWNSSADLCLRSQR